MTVFWQIITADAAIFVLLGYWWGHTRVELMETIRLVETQIREESYQELRDMIDDKFRQYQDIIEEANE